LSFYNTEKSRILQVLLVIVGKRYKPAEVFQIVLEYRSYGW